jgi:hypothetical protein
MPAEIRYGGRIIATVESGKTKVIECAKTTMENDVFVTSSEDMKPPVLQEKIVTESGDVLPDEGYDGLSKVIVDVPIPEPVLQEKTVTITENGIIEITPDEGYDGLSKVDVDVDSGVDVSGDTVTPDTMLEGVTAHNASGQQITGTIKRYRGEVR